MVLTKKIREEIRDYIILILLGIVMTYTGLSCRNCRDNPEIFWIIASFTSLIWILLWKGNGYLADFITTKISWIDRPVERFFVGLVTTILYTVGVMYVVGAIWEQSFDVELTRSVTISIYITLAISLFMHSRAFLINWREATLEAGRYQKESIAAKYESLKNQVNPHFLFNSLNALTNLVYEDQEKAVQFIKQLSEVYRYVLDTRDKELVSLEEEMKFLHSYLFLQRIRFGDKLRVEVNLNSAGLFLPPLAIQMLLENAIKHNIVSEDDPLSIQVYQEKDDIVVKNNLQKKTQPLEPSSGIGLDNICRRYEVLGQRKVQISEDRAEFTVRLPVITKSNVSHLVKE